jgi:tetratricopeptide (TPR) repeat protein
VGDVGLQGHCPGCAGGPVRLKGRAQHRVVHEGVEFGEDHVGGHAEGLAGQRPRRGRAHPLDPLSVTFTTHIGTDLFLLGRYEEAIHQYRKALELDPGFFMAHWGMSRAYLQLGRHEEALRELQYPGSDYLGFFQPALLGYAHAVAGETAVGTMSPCAARGSPARRASADARTRAVSSFSIRIRSSIYGTSAAFTR